MQNNNNVTTFEGIEVKDLQTVLAYAPKDAAFMLECLKDKELLNECGYRFNFLIGSNGIGKTTLAKAIAHQAATQNGWSYEYISSRAFVGKYRNQTGVCFREYLKKIALTKKPLILIIDQLNKILEYPNSASDDTQFNSDVFCDFFDQEEDNNNLFFMGIMDRATKLCNRLKSRIRMRCIFMKEPIMDPHLKRIIFTSKCINDSTRFHPEVTHEWLTHFLAQAPSITGRNFRGLALEVQEIRKKEEQKGESNLLITQNHLKAALKSYINAAKDINHIDPYEAHVDRQERLHQERLQRMEEEFQQQLQLQIMLTQIKARNNSSVRSNEQSVCTIV